MLKKINQNLSFLAFLLVIVIIHIIWLLMGEKVYITIFDNLDGDFGYIKLLIDSNNLLGLRPNELVIGSMNGIERSFYRSGLNFTLIFYKLFDYASAYKLSHLTNHLIGYFGMFLLTYHYFIKNNFFSAIIAFIFGMIPYYVNIGISVSGQPILLFAFLNIIKFKSKWYDWAIISIFPFFANAHHTLPFYLPGLFILAYYLKYKHNFKLHNFWFGISIFILVSLIVDFPLFYNVFFSKVTSHRVEINLILKSSINLKSAFGFFLTSLVNGKTAIHTGGFQTWPIVILFILSWIINGKPQKTAALFITLNISFLLITSFYCYILYLMPFKTLSMDRFYFLSPLFWFISLFYIINSFNSSTLFHKLLIYICLFFLTLFTIRNNKEFSENLKILKNETIHEVTYSQFIDKTLFSDIVNALPKEEFKKYNFICIGMFPNLAHLYGIKTLDSYQNNYPLAYKKQFRKIIEGELNRDLKLKNYFDGWGSRCYAFSSELHGNFMVNKNDSISIDRLEYNWLAFKEMKGKYILSAVKINLVNNPQLRLIKLFDKENYFRHIFLYEAI